MIKTISIRVDTTLLREQRDFLLSLPSNDNLDGLINLIDELLDIAEVDNYPITVTHFA